MASGNNTASIGSELNRKIITRKAYTGKINV
jgi:hypothetical protein